jgi:SAM-dependent methyltransferase
MNSSPHSASDLELIYKNRFAGLSDYRSAVWKILVLEYFDRWIPTNADVLDVGCGYGEFLNQVCAGKKFGIDLNPQAQRNANKDVTIFQQDCSAPWPIPEQSLDVVFSSNFYEHLPSKTLLEDTIAQSFRCLRPGGRIIAMGPNIKYEPGRYWDYYDHYLPLTEMSMAEIFTKCGYTIEEQIDRFLPFTMADGKRRPTWMLQAYLRMKWVWPLFGRQFLVVARKPSA